VPSCATRRVRREPGARRCAYTQKSIPASRASASSRTAPPRRSRLTFRDPDFDLRGVFTHLAAAEEFESEFTLAQLETFAVRSPRSTEFCASAASPGMRPRRPPRFCFRRCGSISCARGSQRTASGPRRRAHGNAGDRARARADVDARISSSCAGRSGPLDRLRLHLSHARRSRIGVLPIGYAEGIPRSAGGRAELNRGKRAPIVGRICMNMAFVDVTDVPLAHAGSSVTLDRRRR
jgi:hypothetical protein